VPPGATTGSLQLALKAQYLIRTGKKLGSGDVFDQALGDFAFSYADQNDQDYKQFKSAIETGRIQAEPG
jgi:hypothetical protein